ncbi:MAG: hypothetical protein AABY22_30465 [Nanoarchaeota archaeon]
MAFSASSKVQRYRYFLSTLFQQHLIECYFCHQRLSHTEFFPKQSKKHLDGFTIHHLSENREDNSPRNLVFAHRNCHVRHHKNIQRLKNDRGDT